jgi:hypothetical protein
MTTSRGAGVVTATRLGRLGADRLAGGRSTRTLRVAV